MEKEENVKKLSLWQRIKLKFYLNFKDTIPADCRIGAIDAMSIEQIDSYRYSILKFNAKELHPLFEKRNIDKLNKVCSSSIYRDDIEKYLIQSGTDDEIRTYLCFVTGVYVSDDWVEKYFINRHPDDFFKPYLEAHSGILPNNVVKLLIKREQELLLLNYINLFKKDEVHNIPEKLLFASSMETAKYAFAEKFLDDGGNSDTISYILQHGEVDLIKKLLETYSPSSDEEYDMLFEIGNSELIDLAIEKSKLSFMPIAFWSNILKSGTAEQILRSLDKFSLEEDAEFLLVRSQNNEAILHYLQKTKKSLQLANSENYLFAHASEDVLDFYRLNISLPYAEERTLCKEGNAEKICASIKKRDIYLMNAVLLVEKCNSVDVLKLLIEKNKLPSLVEVALIRRNIKEVTDFYISKLIKEDKRLSQPAEIAFMKIGEADIVLKYFVAFDYKLCDDASYAFLCRGDAELLSAFCKEGYINEDIVAKFVHDTSFEVLKSYFDNKISLPPKAEVALVNRKQPNLIKAYFSEVSPLSNEAEIALVHLMDFNLIKDYLEYCDYFYQDAEKEILLSGDDHLFLFYIEQTQLFNDNEVVLVKSGKRAWLEAYIEKYDLCENAADELAKIY